MEYSNVCNKEYYQYEGRILERDGIAYLGYTNSYVRFYAKGKKLSAYLTSNITEEVNMAGLSVFLDDGQEPVNRLVIDKEVAWYDICEMPDEEIHLVTIVKITEAAMSHVGFVKLQVEGGELVKRSFPERPDLKLEFIGDSITCGYGVLGAPEAEYTLRDEDGMMAYAYLAAKELNARARYLAASGHGICVEYTGDPEGNVPKLFPCVNWYIDPAVAYDYSEYVPDVVVINLGTNDSGHMEKEDIQEAFVKAYVVFLHTIKKAYPETKILCTIGTLCDIMYEWIEKAIAIYEDEGGKDVYMRRLPYHNVEEDGMACMHPSPTTHRKDGERVAGFIREILHMR